jgi:CDP-diacylglycerol--glycerol-3-phosphate 3-phosphatidyltransferase
VSTPQTIKEDLYNIPNLLTLFRIALIPIVCFLIWLGDPLSSFLAVACFATAGFTDWLDGYIARKNNVVSLTGKFLDPLADKLLVMASLVMLVPMGRISATIVIIILARELSVMGLRSVAAGEGIIIASGKAGKYKTSFQMTGLIGLFIHYVYTVDFLFVEVRLNFHIVGLWLIIISIIFSLLSAYQYFAGFLRGVEQARGAKMSDG